MDVQNRSRGRHGRYRSRLLRFAVIVGGISFALASASSALAASSQTPSQASARLTEGLGLLQEARDSHAAAEALLTDDPLDADTIARFAGLIRHARDTYDEGIAVLRDVTTTSVSGDVSDAEKARIEGLLDDVATAVHEATGHPWPSPRFEEILDRTTELTGAIVLRTRSFFHKDLMGIDHIIHATRGALDGIGGLGGGGDAACVSGVSATANQDGSIGVAWPAVADADNILVLRATGGGTAAVIANLGGSVTSFVDKDAERGVAYTYTVTANGTPDATCTGAEATAIPFFPGMMGAVLAVGGALFAYRSARKR